MLCFQANLEKKTIYNLIDTLVYDPISKKQTNEIKFILAKDDSNMMYDAFKEDIAVLNIYFAEPTVMRKNLYVW